ncbi:MAG: hypothetical protein GY953_01035, partial [bacterium]|nr:hypothetical protein [bacterium]
MKRISSIPCLGLLAALALTLAAPAAAHPGGGHACGLVKQDLKLYFQTLADARA